MQTGTMFYLQTCYLRYRRNVQIVKDWHYVVITILSLIVSLLQIFFTLMENESHKYYFIGRMMYPIFQFGVLVVSIIFSSKAANLIDEDIFEKERDLCEQAKILLYRTQNVIK